jgi:dTDP-4-amino-4,6-dideoxygalactose transaminase
MDTIMSLAGHHGLAIIEDAAHAPGAEYGGQKAGTFGDVGCFSFFANKNLVTGEGGMAVTRRTELAQRMRRCRSHGMTAQTWDRHQGHAVGYDVVDLGYNYRIDEVRSALGLVQLGRLEENNRRRGHIADLYRQALAGIEGLQIPFAGGAQRSADHLFVVLLPRQVDRNRIREKLMARGIQTSVHYPPIHLFSYYRRRFGFRQGLLPVTEEIARRQLTLPLHPLMTEDHVGRVASALREALDE